MADYNYRVPVGQKADFMVATINAPGNGTSAPTYTIVSGNTNNIYRLGASDGVLEVNSDSYAAVTHPVTLSVSRSDDNGVLTFSVSIGLFSTTSDKKPSIYVDPVNGDNAYPGSMSRPVSSLDLAYSKVMGGGTVLAYSGNYGSRVLSKKPCTFKGLAGNAPILADLTLGNGFSFVVENIGFSNEGISAHNPTGNTKGSLMVRGCSFSGSSAIQVSKYQYVSALKNRVGVSGYGVIISDAEEATVVSNTIHGVGDPLVNTAVSFSTDAVRKLVFRHNTINGADLVSIDDVSSSSSFGVKYVTVTPPIMSTKEIGPFPYNFVDNPSSGPVVAMDLIGGSPCSRGVDFEVVNGNTLSILSNPNYPATEPDEPYLGDLWVLGDVIRLIYELSGTEGAVAGHTKIDSNSITNVTSLAFTSGVLVDLTYNNLFNTNTTAPLSPSNINLDPLYNDPANGDYNLADASPNRKSANPSLSDSLNAYAPYQGNVDNLGANRAYKGEAPDIGAIENLSDVHNRDESVINLGQQGYDVVYDGDTDRPLRRLSKAFSDPSEDEISLNLGLKTEGVSDRKMFFDDSLVTLNGAILSVADPQAQVPMLSKRDTAFIQPFDQPSASGVVVYVSMEGSDTEGEGTSFSPYRTIGYALSTSATVIYALAGSYPLFQGVPGKRIIFVPREDYYLMGGFMSSNLTGSSWQVTESTDTDYLFSIGLFSVTHPAGD